MLEIVSDRCNWLLCLPFCKTAQGQSADELEDHPARTQRAQYHLIPVDFDRWRCVLDIFKPGTAVLKVKRESQCTQAGICHSFQYGVLSRSMSVCALYPPRSLNQGLCALLTLSQRCVRVKFSAGGTGVVRDG